MNYYKGQLLPPSNWQDFQDLCLRIACMEFTEFTQHYGRGGQSQQGVDIFHFDNAGKIIGIQCKKKEQYPENMLSKSELLNEIEKAKTFKPKLDKLVFTTTANRDAKLQAECLQINQEHIKKDLFKIEIWFWEDIVEKEFRFRVNELKSKYIYSDIPDVINRKVSDFKRGYFSHWTAKTLLEVLEKTNRVILLSGAGEGKTTELKKLASDLYEKTLITPYLWSLYGYSGGGLLTSCYIPHDIITFLENVGRSVVLIFDGFDEVQEKYRKELIRQLEDISLRFPDMYAVISSRTNFYSRELEHIGFRAYRLHVLDGNDIETYINKCGINYSEIMKELAKVKLIELIKVPFFLASIIDLYKASGNLPKTRNDLMEKLVKNRIDLDRYKFRNSDNDLNDKEVIDSALIHLRKLAVVMEILGRNHLFDLELKKVIPCKETRKLLNYCTVWERKPDLQEEACWGFEHNNFQEYLAAKAISGMDIAEIKNLVAYPPKFEEFNPSWQNTLSFLCGMFEQGTKKYRDFIEWIETIPHKVLIKFEPDLIPDETRTEIFRTILGSIKKTPRWLDTRMYYYDELAEFGSTDQGIKLILKEIADMSNDYIFLSVVIRLAGYASCNDSNQHMRIIKELLSIIYDIVSGKAEHSIMLVSDAIYALNTREYRDPDTIAELIELLENEENTRVKFTIYELLHNSGFCDNHYEFLIKGIPFCIQNDRFLAEPENAENFEREPRLLDESFHLKKCIDSLKSPDALKALINAFMENTKFLVILRNYSKEYTHVDVFIKNLVNAYKLDKCIYDLVLNLTFELINRYKIDEAEWFVPFFNKTGTNKSAFFALFDNSRMRFREYSLLAQLADEWIMKEFIKNYRGDKYDDNNAWQLLASLKLIEASCFEIYEELFDSLSEARRTGDEEQEEERKPVDWNLIFEKDKFLKQLEKELPEEIDFHELISAKSVTGQILSAGNIHYRMVGSKPVSKLQILQFLDRAWRNFQLSVIAKKHFDDRELHNLFERDRLKTWGEGFIDNVSFRDAMHNRGANGVTSDLIAIALAALAKERIIDVSDNILLDMLSFDFLDQLEYAGIEWIEVVYRGSEHNITERIMQNIKEGIEVDQVMKNHVNYLIKHKIEGLGKECMEIACSDRDEFLLERALEYLCIMNETENVKVVLAHAASDEMKWKAAEKLLNSEIPFVKEQFLIPLLHSEETEDRKKLRACGLLMQIGDIEGIKQYIDLCRQHNAYIERNEYSSVLEGITDVRFLPYIFELQELSYQSGFRDSKISSIYQKVYKLLVKLGTDEANNQLVKDGVREFIERNKHVNVRVGAFKNCINEIDLTLQTLRANNISIEDAITKTDSIFALGDKS